MFANFEVTPSFLFTVLLACNKLQPSKPQVDCSNYPCYNEATCMPGPADMCICSSVFLQPVCTISCQNIQVPCVNGGCFGEVCSCPTNFAGPTCESAIFAYLNPVAVTVSEGNNDNDVTVQVCRQPTNSAITMGVSTSLRSAASPSDYININTAVTISIGQVCTPVDISIVSDMTFEPTEVFDLVIFQVPQSVHIVPGQQTATVTIIDNDGTNPPVISNCPFDFSRSIAPGTSSTSVSWQPPTASDNSGDVTLTSSHQPGDTFFLGQTTVTYTAVDGAGNAVLCQFVITVMIDIDECSTGSHTCDVLTSECMNTLGFYRCDCRTGYTGESYFPGELPTCEDRDECTSNVCDSSSSTCMNTMGSYICECKSGYTGSSFTPGQQFTCTDRDECTTSNLCDSSSSTCMNTFGSYRCMCRSGYTGSTFTPGQQFTCTDRDECTITLLRALCDRSSSTCMNTIGSYMCMCTSGYTGSPYTPGLPSTCTDLNECAFSNMCDSSSSTCMNTIGSYRCVCKSGYTGSPYTPPGQPTCTDINECLTPQSTACDLTRSDCFNRNGGYVCMCKTGFIGMQQYPSSEPQSPCQADVTPPVISGCPSDIFHTVQIGTPDMTVFWTAPTATDNSGTATLENQSHSRGSSFPVGTTTVTYRYADPAGNEADCTFDVIIQEDCFTLYTAGQCRPNECSCTKGTCTSPTGRCESSCSVFQCPANIASESLSQVNPQSSVEIKCILEGSTAVVNILQIRLSRSEQIIIDNGITQETMPDISDNRREETYRVIRVSEDDQFFCILSQSASIVGSINVTGFVYKLPSISDPPTEVTRTTTSVTITWRPWDDKTDVGDPLVVAYIPYYRMDPSQDWMSGSRIQADQTLEYTASSLETDRNYTFSVAVVREGEGGEGPRGPPVTIKTLCIEVVPQMVTTTLTATNDVTVTWQQPTVQCSTGITQFTIYYEIEGDVSSRKEAGIADPNAETFTVDGSLLEPGMTYNIAVTVTTDQESAMSEGSTVTATKPTGSPGSLVAIIIGVVIVVLIVLILLLLIFIVVRKRKMEDQPDPIYDQPLNDIGKQPGPSGSTDHSSGAVNMALNVTEVKKTKESAVADSSVPDEGGIYGNLEPPSPIKIADFPEYIVNNIGKVEHEFGLLEGVQQKHPWTVAEEEFNRKKNRFRNMYPYDHCRVVLPKLPGDHSSDYYNASFILNARDERAYIASQAPNKASVDDFWRLIWEQNVQTIVMLANLYEATKERCLQYWPKEESETQSFGYIDVTWTKTQHFADYVIRTLSVKRDRTTRDIEQLHFKEWPDKDIPDNAMCLVEFARHCKLIHFKKQTPFLIHCSAGIGRTGTFIGLLSMMDVLQSEEYIDIFAFVNKMRENRVNMIQTKQQYRYLHTCLYEFHLTRDCQISARSLSRFKIKDNKAAILREFQLLSEMEMSMATDSHKTGRTTDTLGRGSSSDSHETDGSMAREHAPRDRFGNMVPLGRQKLFMISSSPSNPDNYINASFVKSYEKKDAFITTQSPLPNTIEDFWRMIYDHKCRTVVMLNQLDGEDKTCVQYWPNRGSLQYGIMTVTCIATEQHSDYVKRTFDVTLNNSANVISVTHLQLEDWPPKGSPQSLIRLITDAHKLQEEANVEKPLVVHCINGFGRSGVFVTVQSEIERIRATGLVDIFATVKKLRNEHQHMMKKKMEYKLCFDFLIEFSKRYDNYENW